MINQNRALITPFKGKDILNFFEVKKYSDQQTSVSLKPSNQLFEEFVVRINSNDDLISLLQFKDVLRDNFKKVVIPCLFGQRSDRRFEMNQSFDLKVIANIINSCNFEKVTIIDAHSDVSAALLNNCVNYDPFPFVEYAFKKLSRPTLVSPDAGAYKKVFKYAEKLNAPLVAANKFRDSKGEIFLSVFGDVRGKRCLIVDDYVDGGRTFITLAKKLKELGADQVYVYITHALFSYGTSPFEGIVDGIFCTNTIKDLANGFNGDKIVEPKIFIDQLMII